MAAIEQQNDKTWTFTCALERCGFTSTGHPTKKSARDRQTDHMAEHEGITDGDHSN